MIGDDAAQYRRMSHAVDRHGVVVVDCACECRGCAACEYLGSVIIAPANWTASCGRECPFNEVAPQ